MSLEYYGHEYFVPNHHNLILWESLVCYMFPVMANHLSWYDTVLLPSTGYAKTLLEFLIQHNSHKSNQKVSFDAVNYSSLLVMIGSSLISCFVHVIFYGCSNVAKLSWKKIIFLRKKYVWFLQNLFFFLKKKKKSFV